MYRPPESYFDYPIHEPTERQREFLERHNIRTDHPVDFRTDWHQQKRPAYPSSACKTGGRPAQPG
jgi:hypothetical protein